MEKKTPKNVREAVARYERKIYTDPDFEEMRLRKNRQKKLSTVRSFLRKEATFAEIREFRELLLDREELLNNGK